MPAVMDPLFFEEELRVFCAARRQVLERGLPPVDFSCTPKLHIAFCTIFVHPFLTYTP